MKAATTKNNHLIYKNNINKRSVFHMFNPFKKFNSLEELEQCHNLVSNSKEDEQAIITAWENDLELSYDELNRVWTEGERYIADLKMRT